MIHQWCSVVGAQHLSLVWWNIWLNIFIHFQRPQAWVSPTLVTFGRNLDTWVMYPLLCSYVVWFPFYQFIPLLGVESCPFWKREAQDLSMKWNDKLDVMMQQLVSFRCLSCFVLDAVGLLHFFFQSVLFYCLIFKAKSSLQCFCASKKVISSMWD